MLPPVSAVHDGRHVVGVPEQPEAPLRSNAYSLSSDEPTNAKPSATVGAGLVTPPPGPNAPLQMRPSSSMLPSPIVFSAGLNPVPAGSYARIGQSHPASSKTARTTNAITTRRP